MMNGIIAQSKRCSSCGQDKPLDEFYPKKGRTSRSSHCKECQRKRRAEYVQAVKDGVVVPVSELQTLDDLRNKIRENSCPEPNSGCWLWELGLISRGYGRLFFGEEILAHRHSYIAFVGPVADGLQVLHHCDTPCCVRPAHLFLGTHDDNMEDCRRKGRQAAGERNWNSKVTESDVIEILSMRYLCGLELEEIEAKTGKIQSNSISRICNGQLWRILSDVREEILSFAGQAPAPKTKMSAERFYRVLDVWFDQIVAGEDLFSGTPTFWQRFRRLTPPRQ